jgi:acyl-[acyl-carrier-protein] desaturase
MTDLAVSGVSPSSNQAFRDLGRDFFDHAELKRRWNVTADIPWAEVKLRAVDEDLVDILEAFYCTEMYLPDYTARLLHLNRQNQGLAWFITNWGYEESKHSLVIEEWLVRSGRRTPQHMERLNEELLAGQWKLPFETSRQMLVYTLLQELATQLSYINLSKLTAPAGDGALQRMLLLIAGDEGSHHRMFASCLKVHLASDRAGTLGDIAHVLQNFEMPAHDVIPDWARRGALIERHQVFGARPFVRRVMLPALEHIGVDRRELTQGPLAHVFVTRSEHMGNAGSPFE